MDTKIQMKATQA